MHHLKTMAGRVEMEMRLLFLVLLLATLAVVVAVEEHLSARQEVLVAGALAQPVAALLKELMEE
jgi:hypothetical protein